MKALFLLAWLVMGAAQAEDFSARVIAVIDGDTVMVRRAHGVMKIRLADIDAPESDQAFGADSQRALASMVMKRQVSVSGQATDQYGRLVAHIRISALDVNTEQIRRGMAWEYSHFHGNKELIALEAEARDARLGLWAGPDPVQPWEWRKQHPHAEHAAPAASSDPACRQRKRCAQFHSCEEAQHALKVCGWKYLDGNHDGIPCAKLCGSRHK